jgi:uncharacterized membrane protein YczE
MREPTRLRGSLSVRLCGLVLGLLLFAAGIVALLESRLGLSAWDVLHQRIAPHTPLSFGEANVAVGIGTLFATAGIGPSVEGAFWLLARLPLALGWRPQCFSA